MAKPRYRVIVKILCEDCSRDIENGKPLNTRCERCQFKKWNTVNNLISFTNFLHKEHPRWIWFNVYQYIKGQSGSKLASFQKGKNEPNSVTLKY